VNETSYKGEIPVQFGFVPIKGAVLVTVQVDGIVLIEQKLSRFELGKKYYPRFTSKETSSIDSLSILKVQDFKIFKAMPKYLEVASVASKN
jgi:hypothetical protein